MPTSPLDPYVGIIEEMRSDIKAIRGTLLGTLSTPGLAERQRRLEETQREHTERLERHSARLLELEQAGVKRMQWTVRTFFERAIGALAACIIGAVSALFATQR